MFQLVSKNRLILIFVKCARLEFFKHKHINTKYLYVYGLKTPECDLFGYIVQFKDYRNSKAIYGLAASGAVAM